MPAFDATQPVTSSTLASAPVRDNFNALKQIIDAQATVIADLTARVSSLEGTMATRAAKPTSSPLSYGASDPPTQGEVQGGFDLMANLIGELNA